MIYVNDLYACLDTSIPVLFADDSTLLVTANNYKSLFEKANCDLGNLYDWLCLNKLTVNEIKTKYMIFTLSNKCQPVPSSLELNLNGTQVESVENYKFLGLHINDKLNWKNHMQELLSKIRRNLSVVRKVAYFLNEASLLQLYHSLIISHIRYGITVWHHGHIALRKKIQACANKFLRLIFSLDNRASVRNIMKERNILSVNQLFHVEVSKIMQRVALKTIPLPFQCIFENQMRGTLMQTRSSSSFFQTHSYSTKCKQAIRVIGPVIWNKIPENIKKEPVLQNTPHSPSRVLTTENRAPLRMTLFSSSIKKHVLNDINFI